MTLDEAIQHCEEVSRDCNNAQCSIDHMQLRQWLLELKQYRERDRISKIFLNEKNKENERLSGLNQSEKDRIATLHINEAMQRSEQQNRSAHAMSAMAVKNFYFNQ